MKEMALTTSDNPYNPITQFDDWYLYDESKGYHSCSYLARIANTSSSLPDDVNDESISLAIDEICMLNLIGIVTNFKINYEKVVV